MTLKINIIKEDKMIVRTIEEIVDTEGKTSLGIASGINKYHCFYMAERYCKSTDNFLADVKYYRICGKEESLDPKCAITVEFYK